MAEDQQQPNQQPGYDKSVYLVVVITLALVVLTTAASTLVLLGKEAPQSLISLGSTAMGALAGLLAPSPLRNPR